MATPLTTLAQVASILDRSYLDPASTALLSYYIQEATQIILDWCKRADFGLVNYTEMRSGNNSAALAMRQLPIQGQTINGLSTTQNSPVVSGFPSIASQSNLFDYQSILTPNLPGGSSILPGTIAAPQLTLSQAATAGGTAVALTDSTTSVNFTGTTTASSTTITNVSSITGLTVGDTITGTGIPGSTTIAAITTGQVTASQAATATATNQAAQFGIALWSDDNAFGGAAAGAFAATTLLQEGVDYYLDYDNGPGGACSSGLVYRLGYYWFQPSVWYGGLVTPQTGPPTLNVKVRYNAGYTAVPASVQAACELLVAQMCLVRKFGQSITEAHTADMGASFTKEEKYGLLTAPIRELLTRYKIVSVVEN